jgi:poly-gamma-glutamate synthesis protein (capsule biosynthesis protein)
VPLAVAVHPTRDGLTVTSDHLRALRAGEIHRWGALGARDAPLRVTRADEVLEDRNAVALLPATDVCPPLAVAAVDGVDPIRSPDDYPVAVDGPPIPPITTVTVTGDLMLGRRVGDRLSAAEDPAAVLRPTAERLAAVDLTIGNLESTLSRAGRPRQGGDSFAAAPNVRAGLRLAGFDVLSLANNHVGDFGPTALVRTVRRVEAGGFRAVGAGRDLPRAAEPVVVRRNGISFGIMAFDAIGETPAAGQDRPGALRLRMQPRTGPLVPADLERVLGIVRRLRSEVDVVMVLPHWGTQYIHRTVPDQRRVARSLVRAGADIVAGGHPHWVQGVESVGPDQRGLVAYSLGNFVFDMDFMRKTQEGVVLELTFWGAVLRQARLVPVVIGPDFAPRFDDGPRGRSILADVWRASRPPLRGTHDR